VTRKISNLAGDPILFRFRHHLPRLILQTTKSKWIIDDKPTSRDLCGANLRLADLSRPGGLQNSGTIESRCERSKEPTDSS
jgi:hypothetical protein